MHHPRKTLEYALLGMRGAAFQQGFVFSGKIGMLLKCVPMLSCLDFCLLNEGRLIWGSMVMQDQKEKSELPFITRKRKK